MCHDTELHQKRIQATLLILETGGVTSLYEAYKKAGNKVGAAAPTVVCSWSFATTNQIKQRDLLDPMAQQRKKVVQRLIDELSSGAHETYNRACISVAQKFGVTSVAVRRMAERMCGTHPFWETLYEHYPDTHS